MIYETDRNALQRLTGWSRDEVLAYTHGACTEGDMAFLMLVLMKHVASLMQDYGSEEAAEPRYSVSLAMGPDWARCDIHHGSSCHPFEVSSGNEASAPLAVVRACVQLPEAQKSGDV